MEGEEVGREGDSPETKGLSQCLHFPSDKILKCRCNLLTYGTRNSYAYSRNDRMFVLIFYSGISVPTV